MMKLEAIEARRDRASRLRPRHRVKDQIEGSSKSPATYAPSDHEDTEQGAPTNAGETPAPSTESLDVDVETCRRVARANREKIRATFRRKRCEG